MDSLKVALSMVPVDGLAFDLDITEQMVRPEGVDSPRIGPLRLSGEIRLVDTEVLVQGTLTGAAPGTCDRCLGPAEVPIDVDVDWLFVPGLELNPYDTDEDNGLEDAGESTEIAGTYDGETLDLAEPVWEETVLAVPSKMLCRADCAGLCPHCGANLNETACACATRHAEDDDNANTGLRKLGDLFPHLKPNHPEE